MPAMLVEKKQDAERNVYLGLADFGMNKEMLLKPGVFQKIGEFKVPKNQAVSWGSSEKGKGNFYFSMEGPQGTVQGTVRLKSVSASGKENVVLEERTEKLSDLKKPFTLKGSEPVGSGGKLVIELCPDAVATSSSKASNSAVSAPIKITNHASNSHVTVQAKVNLIASNSQVMVPVESKASNTRMSVPVESKASNTKLSVPVKKK